MAPMEMFTDSKTDRHPTELAMLKGARLVTAQETEEGRNWAESRIKAMTGGDPITARFMRQDFFTFDPQFKLFICGNHKPALRNVDVAIRRRFRMWPFNVEIPEAEQDQRLVDKLKAEWPMILNWMIEGCLKWQEDGLVPSEAVIAATAAYFEEEDDYAQWLKECVETDTAVHGELTSELFSSWKQWAEHRGLAVGSIKKLSTSLKAKHIDWKEEPGTKRSKFFGIKLIRHNYTDDPRYGG